MKQPEIIGFTFCPCPVCGKERYTSDAAVPCAPCQIKKGGGKIGK